MADCDCDECHERCRIPPWPESDSTKIAARPVKGLLIAVTKWGGVVPPVKTSVFSFLARAGWQGMTARDRRVKLGMRRARASAPLRKQRQIRSSLRRAYS